MKPVSQRVQAGFDRFWAAYPYRRENPKAPALVVFARLVAEGVDMDALVAAAQRYADLHKAEKTPSIFIPHARKWLNQRYFEDYMTDDQASAQATPGPNPDHPLAALYGEVGPGPWASYFEPLEIVTADGRTRVIARTRFGLDRLRDTWGRQVEGILGPVAWEVRG